MAGERMSLCWNKFEETAAAAFRYLGASDVTLASEDGKQVKAHRAVLSSCSPVLRKILLEMSDPDPVLDMKGMTMEEISLLLKFIYTGEVMVMTMMMLQIVIMFHYYVGDQPPL